MPRSILSQREQWAFLRFADDADGGAGNQITAPGTPDIDNPAQASEVSAFSPNQSAGVPSGQINEGGPLEDAAAIQRSKSQSGTPAGGAVGPAAGTPGLPKLPTTPGTGVGAGGAAPASGDEASWKARIKTDITPQLQQRGITDPAAQQKAVDSIYQQGLTESGWRDIPQAITDVNSQKGTPAQSYLQYVPSTFEHAQDLAGTPQGQRNIHDPDQQIKGVIPLEESEGKFGPGGFSDSSGSGVGYGHGWG